MRTERDTEPGRAPAQVVWFEYVVTDLEQAASFYGALLGWTFSQLDGYPGEYLALDSEVGSLSGGLVPAGDGLRAGGGSAVYAGVPDLDLALEEAKRVGCSFVEPILSIEGVGRFAAVGDPDGNRIGLFEL